MKALKFQRVKGGTGFKGSPRVLQTLALLHCTLAVEEVDAARNAAHKARVAAAKATKA